MEDNINISDLEAKKKELENKLLQLQINHFDKSKKPIAFYVTISISIITIAWTIIQGFNAIISKNKEIELSNNQFIMSHNEQERRYKLDLVKFISDNQKLIFSNDTNEQKRIRNVMLVTFPTEITNATFQKIYEISENKISKNIWTEGSNISKQISKIDEFAGIHIYIFYSVKNASTIQIVAALEKFGLQITKMNSSYEKINTIWFSQDVDIKAVKRLAIFLIENKIDIEKIVYHKNTNWKQKITIGNHGFKKEFPKFTKEQIDTM